MAGTLVGAIAQADGVQGGDAGGLPGVAEAFTQGLHQAVRYGVAAARTANQQGIAGFHQGRSLGCGDHFRHFITSDSRVSTKLAGFSSGTDPARR